MRCFFLSLVCVLAAGCGGNVRTEPAPDGGTAASTTGTGTGTGGAGGGSAIDPHACGSADTCVAALVGCCPPCGPLELPNFSGVNANRVNEFRAATCPVPMACPRCATYPNTYIGARCVASRCEAFDVRKVPEFSACMTDSDCRLRKGLGCCECSATGEWTAISIKGGDAFAKAVCGSSFACDPCGPVPPQDLVTGCVNGHCEVFVLL